MSSQVAVDVRHPQIGTGQVAAHFRRGDAVLGHAEHAPQAVTEQSRHVVRSRAVRPASRRPGTGSRTADRHGARLTTRSPGTTRPAPRWRLARRDSSSTDGERSSDPGTSSRWGWRPLPSRALGSTSFSRQVRLRWVRRPAQDLVLMLEQPVRFRVSRSSAFPATITQALCPSSTSASRIYLGRHDSAMPTPAAICSWDWARGMAT